MLTGSYIVSYLPYVAMYGKFDKNVFDKYRIRVKSFEWEKFHRLLNC